MADIAAVFHWRAEDMRAMDIDELLDWHARAIERLRAMTGAGAAAR